MAQPVSDSPEVWSLPVHTVPGANSKLQCPAPLGKLLRDRLRLLVSTRTRSNQSVALDLELEVSGAQPHVLRSTQVPIPRDPETRFVGEMIRDACALQSGRTLILVQLFRREHGVFISEIVGYSADDTALPLQVILGEVFAIRASGGNTFRGTPSLLRNSEGTAARSGDMFG